MRPTTPGGRIKVTDHVIWLNVVPPDGVPRRVTANKGESLLEVLKRNNVPGVVADCNGGDQEASFQSHQVPFDYYSAGVSCGQCTVHIGDPWYSMLNRMPSTEQRVLDKRSVPITSYARLACCVRVMPEHNEMIIAVGNNRSQSEEFFTGDKPDAF